jgi:predicted N-acetyltransferase YhbS
MRYQVDHLYSHPQHRLVIARTIYEEFWTGTNGYSQDDLERLLGDASSPDRIPLSLVALVGGTAAGTVNLIDNDDTTRPHLHPWLAALVVLPEYRGVGIGSALVRRLLDEAARLGYVQLYLGTETPEFYRRFSAEIVEQARDTLVVMCCSTDTGHTAQRGDGGAGQGQDCSSV